ncbi:hypothetical protein NHQ30_003238 [Ciborinia camelliae]|nr:hypothetical protein NHQ30_003238 [Ciborinia camelliae]
MYLSVISILASSSLILARNLPRSSFQSVHDVGIPGWSLQADICPVGSTSCGSTAAGACCPSSMICAQPANSEVAACCPTGKSISLPQGSIGSLMRSTGTGSTVTSIIVNTSSIPMPVTSAPTTSTIAPIASSVTSITSIKTSTSASNTANVIGDVQAVASSSSSKVLSSKAATSTISKASSITSSAAATSKSESNTIIATSNAAATGKPVFFHYMVGGINDAHCEQDIIDAIALGVDAFALNLAVTLDSSNSWAVSTVASLFKYAQTHNFKLFFSFDMTGFTAPSQFIPILKTYVTNSAYYTYSGQPFVSTFNGGASTYTFGQATVNDGWKVELQEVMSASGHPIYFIPSFQDVSASSSFFTTQFPSLNGTFNWNSWPTDTAGSVPVNTIDDTTYQTAAKASNKGFMMGISPLQFKHISASQNWYRRGESNLEIRFGQILSLQPDFIEFQTWNDAGESHYMGNSWPEPLVNNGTPEALSSLAYDHTGYWQILASFIRAWKSGARDTAKMVPTSGKDAQGTFWHHTLLKDADCGGDVLGLRKPDGVQGVEDRVTAVVLVARGVEGLVGSISVGGVVLGVQTLYEGFNTMVVNNITTGSVVMSVTNSAGMVVVGGKGPLEVVRSADLCNYNFQVVGLS